MAFRLELPVDAKCDFGLTIEPFLRRCYGFGKRLESALDRAEAQIGEISASANRMPFDRLSKNTYRAPAACREGRHLATGGRQRRLWRRVERCNSLGPPSRRPAGEIHASSERILTARHRGECHHELLPGLRHLAIGRAITRSDADEGREMVYALAVFFGAQSYVCHMLARLLEE